MEIRRYGRTEKLFLFFTFLYAICEQRIFRIIKFPGPELRSPFSTKSFYWSSYYYLHHPSTSEPDAA